MKTYNAVQLAVLTSLTLGLIPATATAQLAPVNLRSTSSFALLAGTTITVTGAGTITGNLGIFPGTAYVAGNPAVTVNGTVFAGGPVAAQAQADLTTAYNDAAGRSTAPITISGNIGGLTLAPGLYKSTSSLAISSGNLTLDAQGNGNAVWIFQIASTLTTTSGLKVILANGANPANIFWQVGTSATIGTTCVFQGNIMAAISISMLTGSTLSGRALAMGGAVSLDTGGGTSATIPVAPVGPAVTSTVPVNLATGVAISSKLSATFSEAMNASTINSSTFTLKQGTTQISGVISYIGSTATFAPSSALSPNTTYTATITTGAADPSGNTLASNFVWSFTTGSAGSVIPPTVISTVPAIGGSGVPIGNKLSATFSEAMDPSTFTASTFMLAKGGSAVAGTVTYVGVIATFTPTGNLTPSTSFVATITTGVKDLSGNALAFNYVWSFTTGATVSTTGPVALSTSPANGATGVGPGGSLSVTFNEPLDPSTINTSTFTLQQGSTPVSGTVIYSGNTATFVPSSSLTPATTYTGTILTGVSDLGGTPLASPVIWNFTTAPAAGTSPLLNLSGLVNAADYVPGVAAGSIAVIFGTNLSVGTANSFISSPLPTTLAQSVVTIGSQAAPLYLAMPTQVNVQIPWEVAGQSQTPISATVNGVASNTQFAPLVPFAPGIFTTNMQGSGQGAVLIAGTGQLAQLGAPAVRGGYVSIFCTGLGPVSNQPATGSAALVAPQSLTTTMPTVTIGGVAATLSYSGLAPGFVGLYQVNAQIPASVTPGNAVTVVISMGNFVSNSVTIAVQ